MAGAGSSLSQLMIGSMTVDQLRTALNLDVAVVKVEKPPRLKSKASAKAGAVALASRKRQNIESVISTFHVILP